MSCTNGIFDIYLGRLEEPIHFIDFPSLTRSMIRGTTNLTWKMRGRPPLPWKNTNHARVNVKSYGEDLYWGHVKQRQIRDFPNITTTFVTEGYYLHMQRAAIKGRFSGT
jgi:hypothetical protein